MFQTTNQVVKDFQWDEALLGVPLPSLGPRTAARHSWGRPRCGAPRPEAVRPKGRGWTLLAMKAKLLVDVD